MWSTSQYKEEILKELNGLSSEEIKEVLNFVHFIKVKDIIDPSQAYFWTQQWQEMEKEVEKDKKEENIIGDGTIQGLLQEIKQ